MKRTILAALALGWCLAAHGAAAQQAAVDQAAIARELLSKDPGRVVKALNALDSLAVIHLRLGSREDYRFREGFEPTAGLVEALIAAYEHEVALAEPNGELQISLHQFIVMTKHPLTIDVLTRSLYTGTGALDGLLYFGPSVLPGVVDLAMSPEATPHEADGAMFALRKAVERWGGELGPEIRETMKAAVILHLEGAPDSFASAAYAHMSGFLFDEAAALAEALRDPELTAIARDARHPSTGEPGIPDAARKRKAMRGN